MTEQIEGLLTRSNATLHEAQRLFYATRGSELQEQCVQDLLRLRDDIGQLKRDAAQAQDEDTANMLFALGSVVTSFCEGLRMWIAMKTDRMGEAWAHLVNAQESIGIALRGNPGASAYQVYAKRLGLIEAVVFPPQSFVSVGMVIHKSECSICGLDLEDCDHVPGRLYLGDLCYQIVKDAKLVEVSHVDDPASKHHRVTAIQERDGSRDTLTWRMVKHPRAREEKESAESTN